MFKGKFVRKLTLGVIIFVVFGLSIRQALLSFVFPLAGIAGYGCPSMFPQAFENYARIRLPPSTRNLESRCMGMQGWIAAARFDMNPEDVDLLIDGTRIPKPLLTELPQEVALHDDPEFLAMTSYLYGETEYRDQWVLIDTSKPDVYRVYVRAMGGN